MTDTGSVALRVPSHGVALSLLRAFGRAIAAPSANLSGCVSATRAEHVISAFSGSEEPALVLDSSDVCEAGIESDGCFFYGKRGGLCFALGGCFGCGDGGSFGGEVVGVSGIGMETSVGYLVGYLRVCRVVTMLLGCLCG